MSSFLNSNGGTLAKACNAAGAIEGILLASEVMKIDLKEVYESLGSDSGWDDKALKEAVSKVSLKCEDVSSTANSQDPFANSIKPAYADCDCTRVNDSGISMTKEIVNEVNKNESRSKAKQQ